MPRYSLNRSPWTRMTSPGASSEPASTEPSMTVSAPAAIAFAMSPELRIPPSAISGTPCGRADARALVDRGHLRHADAGHDPGRAGERRARSPHLHAVHAGIDQGVGRLRRWRRCRRRARSSSRDQLPRHLDDAAGVAVRRVEHEHVDARGGERLRALDRVRADADGSADPEPPLRVLGRVRKLEPLRDVLDRDQPLQATVGIDDRQLLDLVPMEDLLRLGEGRPDRRGDEVRARHQRADRLRGVGLEAQVAVGQDPDEHAVGIRDRDAGDAVVGHQRQRLARPALRDAASPARRSSRPRTASPCRPRRPGPRSRGCGGRSRSRRPARARSRAAPR